MAALTSALWRGVRPAPARTLALAQQSRGVGFAQMRAPQQADPYAILGLKRGAARKDIKEAYRRAALRTHPDKPEGSAVEFRRVTDAYKKLTMSVGYIGARLGQRYKSAAQAAEQPAWKPRETFRTVKPQQAEKLFRRAFGRGVDEVLNAEMQKSGVPLGVHSNAIREALFIKFLTQARMAAHSAGDGAGTGAGAGPAAGEANPEQSSRPNLEKAKTLTREKLTNVKGVPVIRVKSSLREADGRVVESFTDKPVYRM